MKKCGRNSYVLRIELAMPEEVDAAAGTQPDRGKAALTWE
jgi:hypothetical protein